MDGWMDGGARIRIRQYDGMIERGATDGEDVKSTDAEDVQEMRCARDRVRREEGRMDGWMDIRTGRVRKRRGH